MSFFGNDNPPPPTFEPKAQDNLRGFQEIITPEPTTTMEPLAEIAQSIGIVIDSLATNAGKPTFHVATPEEIHRAGEQGTAKFKDINTYLNSENGANLFASDYYLIKQVNGLSEANQMLRNYLDANPEFANVLPNIDPTGYYYETIEELVSSIRRESLNEAANMIGLMIDRSEGFHTSTPEEIHRAGEHESASFKNVEMYLNSENGAKIFAADYYLIEQVHGEFEAFLMLRNYLHDNPEFAPLVSEMMSIGATIDPFTVEDIKRDIINGSSQAGHGGGDTQHSEGSGEHNNYGVEEEDCPPTTECPVLQDVSAGTNHAPSNTGTGGPSRGGNILPI